jgi:hypothetical protein
MTLIDELRSDPTKCNTISCCLLAICILLIMIMILVVHGNLGADLKHMDADLKADRAAEKKMGFFAYLASLFHRKKRTKPASAPVTPAAAAAPAPAQTPAGTRAGFTSFDLTGQKPDLVNNLHQAWTE